MALIILLFMFLLLCLFVFMLCRAVIYVSNNLQIFNVSTKASEPIKYALFFVSLIIGIGLNFVVYNSSPIHRIVGFPIPVAVWELSNGVWLDFVYAAGSVTLCLAIFNAFAGIFMIYLLACIAIWTKRYLSKRRERNR